MKRGGVVAFPTDTVYGLGAAIGSAGAVQKVYVIKQRPAGLALPVLIATVEDIDTVAIDVSPLAYCLARRFWPGALTIILKRSEKVPCALAAGCDTIGVRVPDHPVALALVRGAGEPLTGTSANLSGLPPARTAAEVRAQLGGEVDYVIDAGPPPEGIESTIVDATGRVPVIVREGAIKRTDIDNACLELSSEKGVN